MSLLDHGDAFWRSDQHHGTDVLAAGFFQQVDGCNHRAAGGEHRVDDHGQAFVDFRHQLLEVGVGLEGFLVAGHTHGADFGARDQAEHAFEHADAGTQDRHHGNFLAGDFLDRHSAAPAIDIVGFQRQVFGGFIGQQGTDFLSELTEILGADVCAAH
ncbi:hypothetical protein D9M72_545090 [compost metagenome]